MQREKTFYDAGSLVRTMEVEKAGPWLPDECACPLARANGVDGHPMGDAVCVKNLAGVADGTVVSTESVWEWFETPTGGLPPGLVMERNEQANHVRQLVETYIQELPLKVQQFREQLWKEETAAQTKTMANVDGLSRATEVEVSLPPVKVEYRYGDEVSETKLKEFGDDAQKSIDKAQRELNSRASLLVGDLEDEKSEIVPEVWTQVIKLIRPEQTGGAPQRAIDAGGWDARSWLAEAKPRLKQAVEELAPGSRARRGLEESMERADAHVQQMAVAEERVKAADYGAQTARNLELRWDFIIGEVVADGEFQCLAVAPALSSMSPPLNAPCCRGAAGQGAGQGQLERDRRAVLGLCAQ
eukprot:COSAG04_NODE_1417_length_6841_cov_15.033573_2_plen_357_part_00